MTYPLNFITPYPGVLGTIRSPQPKDPVDTVDSEVSRVLRESVPQGIRPE